MEMSFLSSTVTSVSTSVLKKLERHKSAKKIGKSDYTVDMYFEQGDLMTAHVPEEEHCGVSLTFFDDTFIAQYATSNVPLGGKFGQYR